MQNIHEHKSQFLTHNYFSLSHADEMWKHFKNQARQSDCLGITSCQHWISRTRGCQKVRSYSTWRDVLFILLWVRKCKGIALTFPALNTFIIQNEASCRRRDRGGCRPGCDCWRGKCHDGQKVITCNFESIFFIKKKRCSKSGAGRVYFRRISKTWSFIINF